MVDPGSSHARPGMPAQEREQEQQNCPNHTLYSNDDRRCRFTRKLRKVKPEVIAVGRKLSAHDPDVLIIDTGAGQFCLKKRKFFRRGSLRPACGEQVEGATGEAQEIQSTGIAEFEIHNSVDNVTGKSHIIRTGPDAWYGSKLGFNLGSVSALVGLGYGLVINDPVGFYGLKHHKSGTVIPIQCVDGVYAIKMCALGGIAGVATQTSTKRTSFAAAIVGDYVWNQLIHAAKVNEEEAPPRKRRKRKTADKVTCQSYGKMKNESDFDFDGDYDPTEMGVWDAPSQDHRAIVEDNGMLLDDGYADISSEDEECGEKVHNASSGLRRRSSRLRQIPRVTYTASALGA